MEKRRYMLKLALWLFVYAVALTGSIYLLLSAGPNSALLPLFALLPMVPAFVICWVVVGQLRRLDEMQRQMQFEALALAFAATALLTFSYGFLENIGYPKLSMFAIWPLMATLWIIGTLVSYWRYR
ncbi:hypothetical protein [Bartonella sp. LJL80]